MATLSINLPVIVIGAGPVGLAAAAHLLSRGFTPLVLEAGASVGANMVKWSHVRLFSPWKYNVDKAAAALLEESGWESPDPESYPTGGDLYREYLQPLADRLTPYIKLNARVTSVSRKGFDKMKSAGRDQAPFLVQFTTPEGAEEYVLAQAVLDASGSYANPNPMGAAGIPALGERAAASRIFYGIPDVLGADRARYAGKRVMVVGAGHSAMNALLALADLAKEAPGTQGTWVVRRASVAKVFGGGENDGLPARGRLGMELRRLVEAGEFQLVTGFRTTQATLADGQVVVGGETDAGELTLAPVDEVIVATGGRPDLSILSELRLSLDPIVEATPALAPLVDPNLHSCGTVRPHGEAELRHPEPGFYIVGSKSYGRAPTFLMMTGYEQVRSVVAALAGDMEAARLVQLELPETGVCSLSSADGGGSCCGTTESLDLPILSDTSASGCACSTSTPAPSPSSCCSSVVPARRPAAPSCCG
jgi:thioredoxin reductase